MLRAAFSEALRGLDRLSCFCEPVPGGGRYPPQCFNRVGVFKAIAERNENHAQAALTTQSKPHWRSPFRQAS
jgi:hypothetical protein